MRRATADPTARAKSGNFVVPRSVLPADRYEANIDHVLKAAAIVFAEKSFGLATIRDIAAAARISFPRIYYYLRNKEEILYLISRRAFERLISTAEQSISSAPSPAEGLRAFIRNHLDYHMRNLAEMKVLVREADTLRGRYATEISRLKRDYSRICRRALDQVPTSKTLDRERSRILTSLLFGAMNWFYTWYEPARDFDQRETIIENCFLMISGALAREI